MKQMILDIAGVGGAGLVIAGAALLSVPGAMIITGTLLIAGSIIGAKRWAS